MKDEIIEVPRSIGPVYEMYICLIGQLDAYSELSQETQVAKAIEQLEEKVRIYDIQIWAAMQAQSLGLCKKCLFHAIRDIKKMDGIKIKGQIR